MDDKVDVFCKCGTFENSKKKKVQAGEREKSSKLHIVFPSSNPNSGPFAARPREEISRNKY